MLRSRICSDRKYLPKMSVSAESTKIGILGTGDVGHVLASGFASRGFAVKIGTRDPNAAKVAPLLQEVGHGCTAGTFQEATEFGEIVVLAVGGSVVSSVLDSVGAEYFDNKVVIDAVNPLTYNEGGLALSMGFDTSMGETIQQLLPGALVVKCFNTVGYSSMVDPRPISGVAPDMYIAGNDAQAKEKVKELINFLGWEAVIDMGRIEEARLLEPLALLWIKLAAKWHTRDHYVKALR